MPIGRPADRPTGPYADGPADRPPGSRRTDARCRPARWRTGGPARVDGTSRRGRRRRSVPAVAELDWTNRRVTCGMIAAAQRRCTARVCAPRADQAKPSRSSSCRVAAIRVIGGASASARRACSSTWAPTTVRATERVLRLSSRTSSDCSSPATARDTAACEQPRAIAASVKVPSSITATSARNWRSSRFMRPAYDCSFAVHFSDRRCRTTIHLCLDPFPFAADCSAGCSPSSAPTPAPRPEPPSALWPSPSSARPGWWRSANWWPRRPCSCCPGPDCAG